MPATLAQLAPGHMLQVRQIFFETSSRREFTDAAEREQFFTKYVGYYHRQFPECCWVALDQDKVLGYLVASPQTSDSQLLELQPHLGVFQHEVEAYPAHLHINCHHDARGQGVGRLLMEKIEDHFRTQGIRGYHIMTSPDSSNRFFYQKLGFTYEVILVFKGTPVLFMGKNLSTNTL